MAVAIRKMPPISHAAKIGATIVVACIFVGLLVRITREEQAVELPPSPSVELSRTDRLLIPTILLDIPLGAREAQWTKALATALNGATEVTVQFGRADVMTDIYAIEVDFLAKWKEGIGQALHYADASGRIPVLALVIEDEPDIELLSQVERVTAGSGVRLVLLSRASGFEKMD